MKNVCEHFLFEGKAFDSKMARRCWSNISILNTTFDSNFFALFFQFFPVNGEVDSQLLNRVFLGAREKTGLKFIADMIGEKQIPFSDRNRFPRELDFDCGKLGKTISTEALVHAVQDCRLPLAGLGIILEKYCKAFKIPDTRNVLPVIHHILTRYL